MQPGQTIQPGQPSTPAEVPPQPTKTPPQSQPSPLGEAEDAGGQSTNSSTQEAAWHFTGGKSDAPAVAPVADVPSVNWTASEFVSHEKNGSWYLLVILASVALAALVYFISRDFISPAVIVIVGIAFASFGARKPRVLEYVIDNSGVRIGPKLYPYAMFRTFSIIEEETIRSILLMPMQRFNLQINLYYDPTDETRIAEALSVHLPYEERKLATIDKIMHKIRF